MFQFRILSVLFLFFISLSLKAQTDPGEDKESVGDKISQMASMMGGKVKYADSYTFDHSMTMEMTASQKNGKKTNKSVMALQADKEGNAMTMEVLESDGKVAKDKTMILYDIPNSTMVTLLENSKGEKSGMAMGFDAEAIQKMMEDQTTSEADQPTATFKKTGNTRTILGYSCAEYAFDGEDASGTAWVAEDAEVNTLTFFGLLGQGASGKKGSYVMENLTGYPEGLLLEMHSRDKKSNDTVDMVVTDLKLNAATTLKPGDYNVTSLGAMMGN